MNSSYLLPVQLYIRRKNFYPPSRVSDYYAIVVSQVRAEAQSAAYKTLDSGDFLTSEERDVLRWGRNATGTSPKRLSQGGMTKQIYREATAIECLAGYLYLTDALRLHEVMAHLGIESTEN
ncbi:putative Mini-ribonuclease 3 [Nannochloris sp. 'desiccata']|nr:hypothetical protein KSW81_001924 [Chlorella desiccata (nom. nud.)]KAH7616373.1 putative Mini-ribonuclease 3 [Chlorella desiccata (nom. nud.)]KAH7616382.1 putative Mini-ribonuclease 3 [Chlorella desiccata (nom. nud.)]